MADISMAINRDGIMTSIKVSYEVDPESGQIDICKVRRELDKKIIQLTEKERYGVEEKIRGRDAGET